MKKTSGLIPNQKAQAQKQNVVGLSPERKPEKPMFVETAMTSLEASVNLLSFEVDDLISRLAPVMEADEMPATLGEGPTRPTFAGSVTEKIYQLSEQLDGTRDLLRQIIRRL